MAVLEGFSRGDYILVTPLDKNLGTVRDFGTLRGTALDGLSRAGHAIFRMQVTHLQSPDKPLEIRLNANEVDVELIFAASVARLGRE